MLTAVSLFAGIGGFDLALERSGVKVVATCEIDKNAQKILTRHFPNAQLFTDVSTLTGKELLNAGFDPSNGIITGGFPCQDVSVAGKRAGLTLADGTHTRSGLFWQIVRLLEETKAQYFILENVPGLLSSNNGADFATVLTALDELGYGISWRILDAQYFGVPQRRRRIFIVGCLGNPERASQILALAEGRAGYLEKGEQKGKATANPITGGAGSNLEVASTIPAEIYHKQTIVNQDVNSGHLVVPFTPSSFAQYQEGIGTLRSNGGDLGGERNIIGALQARDFKGVGNQYVAENKLVY